MKLLTALPLVLLSTASAGLAVTFAQFDGGADTTWSGLAIGSLPGPAIASGVGPDGSDSLQLTLATNSQQNAVGFNRTIVGAQNVVPFSFQFRINAPATPSADGFSFSLFPTGTYGTAGNVPWLGEEPELAGVLGFGFDTWSNFDPINDPGSADNPAVPTGSDYNDIQVFYNGAVVATNYDPRALGVTLDNDAWHTVSGSVNMLAGTVSLTVDAVNFFNNAPVPGLVPFEYRVGFGARTGGENENVYIDNLMVGIPEPGVTGLAALGLCLLARRRRN